MKYCKQCQKQNSDPNQKFCTRKCRSIWRKVHEIKGAKRKLDNGDYLLEAGITGRGVFDYQGNA